MKKLVLTLSLASSAIVFSYAQEQVLPCGLIQATEALRAKNPGLYQLELQLAAQEEQAVQDDGGVRASKIIPVVVHILHNYGAENISDAQVHDAIRILNEDFQMRQPDTANIAAAFKGIQGNPNFEFRLARKDPNGNCTNGITRTVTTHTFSATEDAKSIAPIWPRDRYMNIWVVQTLENGAGGYTYTPGTATFMPAADGIILVNRQFGSIGTSLGGALSRRTVAHETGHWFNLKHTWGDSNTPGVSCGSDNVDDTPQTVGVASQNCNLSMVSCSNLNNVQNIMDYSSCPIMFTAGQATRITNAANSNTASRNNLWTTSNLTSTGVIDGFSDTLCAAIADFNTVKKLVCAGGTISFVDLSYNGVVTSWAWTFTNVTDGSTVLTSTSQNPTMTFTAPGLYTVSLTVTNASGNSTKTKTQYVRVYPATAQYSQNGYMEDFEGNLDNIGWFIVNDVNASGWQVSTAASVSGTKSMVVRNFNGEGTETYTLYSPSYDLSVVTSPKLRFKYAYADKASGNDDRFRVYISSNCGASWAQLSPPITHTALVSAPASNSIFVPTSSQWLDKEFTIASAYATQNNVRFRFEFEADGGNNFYLDDINIPGSAAIEDPSITGVSWEVFPNPADEYIDIRISGEQASTVSDQLMIYDASGRVVQSLPINGGLSTLRADISMLSPGIYFIKSEKGSIAGTKKIIVR